MFYSVGLFRTSSPGDSISSDLGIAALRRRGEEPGYMEVLQQRAGSLNIKRWLLIKESQITQLRNIALFYVWEDARSGLTEIIPFICTSAIWGQFRYFHVLCFLSSRFSVGRGCSMMAARWQTFFSFLSSLRAYWLIWESWYGWWLWHSCILVYWYSRKHSIFQTQYKKLRRWYILGQKVKLHRGMSWHWGSLF